MASAESLKIEVTPYFELEDFMHFAKENRISSEMLEYLGELWEKWSGRLEARRLKTVKKSWLALWLPEEVENEIELKWTQSSSEGFLLASLAQYMCMSAVEELLPQTMGNGCAPLPELDTDLRQALQGLGLMSDDPQSGSLARRFAILTYYPYAGGCEKCALSGECPKLKGTPEMPVYVLPGHERGNGSDG